MEHDQTQDQSRHSVAEHHELVEQLDGYDMSGPKWVQTAEELKQRVLHHLAEEEREVFPVAGRLLTEPEKAHLAEEYLTDMQRRRAE